VLLATKVLVGFLRGLLTNLDTPPVTSDIRSILVRPPMVNDEARQSISPRQIHYSSFSAAVKQDCVGSEGSHGYSSSPFQPGSRRCINDRSSRPRIPHFPYVSWARASLS
jgi:hypothetical protein